MAEAPNFDHLSGEQCDTLINLQDAIEMRKYHLEQLKLHSKLLFRYLVIHFCKNYLK